MAPTTPLPSFLDKGQRLTDFGNVDLEVVDVKEGGFGLVAIGPDRVHDGRWYALKILKPEVLATSPRARDLFIREALSWVGLWPHMNLLTAYFVPEINGQPFLLLDYAERGSLRELLQVPQPFSARLAWAQDIAAGLVALHTPDPAFLRDQPLVHRDLKPENVLINGAGNAQITDFGLAKVVEEVVEEAHRSGLTLPAAVLDSRAGAADDTPTRSRVLRTARGVVLGTPAYMAPEQWQDAGSAGPPADVYAFGLILSELLAGRHAFLNLGMRHTLEDWRRAHLAGQIRPLRECVPELPEAVETLYRALLAKDPTQRPTAEQALAVLRAAPEAMGQAPYAVLDLYPRTPDRELAKWLLWATVYEGFGLYPGALERCERALALDPRNSPALLERATILDKMGQGKKALAAYDAALAAHSVEDRVGRRLVWNNRSNLLSSLGRYAEAEAAFAQVLAQQPEAADAWHNRALNERLWGQAEAASRRHAEAQRHYERGLQYIHRALDISPNLTNARQLLAVLQSVLGRYAEAEAAYAQALAQQPGVSEVWFNRASNEGLWGQAEAASRRHAEAQRHYERGLQYIHRALDISPNLTNARQLLAALRAELARLAVVGRNRGKTAPEVGQQEEALTIDPQTAATWYNRGVALGQMKRFKEALAAYERALALDPRNATTWDMCGVTLAALGRNKEALAAWARARQLRGK